MTTNKKIIITSFVILLIIIGSITTYKVIKKHHNNLIRVNESKIIDAAKKCFYEKKCNNDTITLKELYEYEYLDKMSNPITKEYYNQDSYIEIKDDTYKFIIKE